MIYKQMKQNTLPLNFEIFMDSFLLRLSILSTGTQEEINSFTNEIVCYCADKNSFSEIISKISLEQNHAQKVLVLVICKLWIRECFQCLSIEEKFEVLTVFITLLTDKIVSPDFPKEILTYAFSKLGIDFIHAFDLLLENFNEEDFEFISDLYAQFCTQNIHIIQEYPDIIAHISQHVLWLLNVSKDISQFNNSIFTILHCLVTNTKILFDEQLFPEILGYISVYIAEEQTHDMFFMFMYSFYDVLFSESSKEHIQYFCDSLLQDINEYVNSFNSNISVALISFIEKGLVLGIFELSDSLFQSILCSLSEDEDFVYDMSSMFDNYLNIRCQVIISLFEALIKSEKLSYEATVQILFANITEYENKEPYFYIYYHLARSYSNYGYDFIIDYISNYCDFERLTFKETKTILRTLLVIIDAENAENIYSLAYELISNISYIQIYYSSFYILFRLGINCAKYDTNQEALNNYIIASIVTIKEIVTMDPELVSYFMDVIIFILSFNIQSIDGEFIFMLFNILRINKNKEYIFNQYISIVNILLTCKDYNVASIINENILPDIYENASQTSFGVHIKSLIYTVINENMDLAYQIAQSLLSYLAENETMKQKMYIEYPKEMYDIITIFRISGIDIGIFDALQYYEYLMLENKLTSKSRFFYFELQKIANFGQS